MAMLAAESGGGAGKLLDGALFKVLDDAASAAASAWLTKVAICPLTCFRLLLSWAWMTLPLFKECAAARVNERALRSSASSLPRSSANLIRSVFKLEIVLLMLPAANAEYTVAAPAREAFLVKRGLLPWSAPLVTSAKTTSA